MLQLLNPSNFLAFYTCDFFRNPVVVVVVVTPPVDGVYTMATR
jgi:hypothetical protein